MRLGEVVPAVKSGGAPTVSVASDSDGREAGACVLPGSEAGVLPEERIFALSELQTAIAKNMP